MIKFNHKQTLLFYFSCTLKTRRSFHQGSSNSHSTNSPDSGPETVVLQVCGNPKQNGLTNNKWSEQEVGRQNNEREDWEKKLIKYPAGILKDEHPGCLASRLPELPESCEPTISFFYKCNLTSNLTTKSLTIGINLLIEIRALF